MDDAASARSIPPHVPASLVRDFNIYSYAVEDGEVQLALYEALRQPGAPEIFWSPYNGGHWVLSRASTIETVINDADRFSNRYIGVPKALNPVRLFRPIQIDPPHHAIYRLLISAQLTPRAIQALKRDARELTVKLVEGFRAQGECEFVSEFAQHMPIGIFMSIVGLPEADRLPLLAIAEKIGRPRVEEERMQGYAELDAYIIRLIEARRDGDAEDFIAQLCRADIDGRSLDQDELIGVIAVVLVAGLDTVAGMLGFVVRFLADNPDRRRELRESPQLIPGAAEEMLRRYAHVVLAREVREDLMVEGVAMRAGDMVVAPLVMHNLDEARFADPFAVDFRRPRKPGHVSFGGRAHHCLGAILARAELQIFLEEWLARIPEFDVRPGAELTVRTRVTSVMLSLPLVWPADEPPR